MRQNGNDAAKNRVRKEKTMAVAILYAGALLIIAAGAAFCAASQIYGFSFSILNSRIPGILFGAVIVFLGIRYFLSVHKLKAEIFGTDAGFSWSNFKGGKK